MTVVKILWQDHWAGPGGWVPIEDIASHAPSTIETVGFLLEDHGIEGCVVVAGSHYDGQYGSVMVIRVSDVVQTILL